MNDDSIITNAKRYVSSSKVSQMVSYLLNNTHDSGSDSVKEVVGERCPQCDHPFLIKGWEDDDEIEELIICNGCGERIQ